jgi:hypothetical protein
LVLRSLAVTSQIHIISKLCASSSYHKIEKEKVI